MAVQGRNDILDQASLAMLVVGRADASWNAVAKMSVKEGAVLWPLPAGTRLPPALLAGNRSAKMVEAPPWGLSVNRGTLSEDG